MQVNRRLKFITILCFLSLFNSTQVLAKNDTPNLDNVTIIVSSCDKYAQFWQPFFASLDKNWPGLHTSLKNNTILLIANSKTYVNDRVQTINIPNEISWSDNMQTALAHVKTKYVLLFLDDYWLNVRVDNNRWNEILCVMKQEDAAYMQLFVDPKEANLSQDVKGVTGIAYKNQFQKYRAALQLAIWETKALQQILRSGESAWDFELAASIRSSGYPKPFLTLKTDAPFVYLNASHLGHITPEALAVAKEVNPQFANSMPVLQARNWRLIKKHIKHRADTIVAMVKRNTSNSAPESYRYIFSSNE